MLEFQASHRETKRILLGVLQKLKKKNNMENSLYVKFSVTGKKKKMRDDKAGKQSTGVLLTVPTLETVAAMDQNGTDSCVKFNAIKQQR